MKKKIRLKQREVCNEVSGTVFVAKRKTGKERKYKL